MVVIYRRVSWPVLKSKLTRQSVQHFEVRVKCFDDHSPSATKWVPKRAHQLRSSGHEHCRPLSARTLLLRFPLLCTLPIASRERSHRLGRRGSGGIGSAHRQRKRSGRSEQFLSQSWSISEGRT